MGRAAGAHRGCVQRPHAATADRAAGPASASPRRTPPRAGRGMVAVLGVVDGPAMRNRRETLKVLLVGSFPPPLGGCSVSLQWLADELRHREDVELRVLDTKGIRGQGLAGALRLARAVSGLAGQVRRVDLVSLHVATTAVPTWGLLVWVLARLAGRPLVLRKFAGTDYRSLGRIRGMLSHFVASHSASYLVETRAHLAASRARRLRNVRWFPTARPMPLAAGPDRPAADRPCRAFVYVGHVCRLKGLEVLVAAMRGMPPDASLDLYGPWFDDLPADLLADSPRIRYHGPLPAADVVATLARYDAFVLPTLATSEGYPGTVLEAWSAGLPVVASRIGAIPEIVDASVGILVEPGDARGLREAMMRLYGEPGLHAALRAGARRRAPRFSSRHWSDRFVGFCREAAEASRAG